MIGANTVIANSLIGDRVVVHPGCAIGQDGFGYVMGAAGHRKVLQVGRVIVQDEVEIGAGTTIDRGANRDTVIGEGTKIDNLVQIGHNVSIGRHCIIVSQCGISGSVVIEDRVILAGQVGLPDNVTIGEGAVIGAKSGVISDVPPGEKWFGYPAMRGREFLRSLTTLHRWVRRTPRPAGATSRAATMRGMNAATTTTSESDERRCDHARGGRYHGDSQSAAASLSILDGRSHHRYARRSIGGRNQECRHQRAAIPRAFPNPVFPALLIEGMAQTAGALCVFSQMGGDKPKQVFS